MEGVFSTGGMWTARAKEMALRVEADAVEAGRRLFPSRRHRELNVIEPDDPTRRGIGFSGWSRRHHSPPHIIFTIEVGPRPRWRLRNAPRRDQRPTSTSSPLLSRGISPGKRNSARSRSFLAARPANKTSFEGSASPRRFVAKGFLRDTRARPSDPPRSGRTRGTRNRVVSSEWGARDPEAWMPAT